jgi:hypothetical protein
MGINCVQFVMNDIKQNRENVENVPIARTTKQLVRILKDKELL